MINTETIINLKDCSLEERTKVATIFINHHLMLIKGIISGDADYCSVDGYTKGYHPVGREIIDAKTFINNNKKLLK